MKTPSALARNVFAAVTALPLFQDEMHPTRRGGKALAGLLHDELARSDLLR